MNTGPSTTVHLRIPLTLRDAIQRRADTERRTWTQMTVLMLTDAAAEDDRRATTKRVANATARVDRLLRTP